MDLSKDFVPAFSAGKRYPVIIVSGEMNTNQNGKQYFEHEMRGEGNQSYKKKFYINTENGRRFYTRFLAACGVSREEMSDWSPEKLDKKIVAVDFKNESWTEFDESGMEHEHSKLEFDHYYEMTKEEIENIKIELEFVYDEFQKVNDPF